jgi:type I restriction enzyme S subunit
MKTKAVIENGFKKTGIGLIPEDWKTVKLGDVAEISSGGSAPQGDNYFNGKNPFIRVQHIDREGDKVIKWDLITDDAVKKYKLKIYPKGTIVFPKSGASIYLEKRAMLPIDAYIVSHLCAVISNDKNVNQKFLFYELRNIELSKDKTDGYPTLNLSEVKNVKVIIPYLLEQQKIAFVLSKIQQSIEQQDKIIQITKELKKSLMNKLFTEGLHGEEQKESEISLIPKTWNIKRLGEIATLQRGKDLPKYEFKEGNIPVIGSNGCIGYHNKAIKQGPGVITGRSGSIGKITYIEGSYWPHNTALYVKDFHDNEPLFVYYLLHRLDFNKYKTGVSVPTLNRNFIHAALLPVPPKKEQVEIANVLFSIDKKLTQVESRKQTLQALFRTMLNQLMTGKVRVKDLDFEVKENV